MARKKTAATKMTKPGNFAGVIRGHTRHVQDLARALRELVHEELPEVEESFYGGQRPMAMYRTTADICWIQPLKERCNVYFVRGPELTDPDRFLEGKSERFRCVKVGSLDQLEQRPLRAWLRESVALNDAAISGGMNFEQVLKKLQAICLSLPNTKQTLTWGKPHFRVGDKIFCGCGEDQGRPRIGLKMEARQSEVMMRLPGIEKASYSRKGDGWVAIEPHRFDDWEEIERLIVGSFRLIAPRRIVSRLDSQQQDSKAGRTSSRRSR